MTAGEPLPRRLAAILAADIAGYSRLMGQDEAVAEFPSVVGATECAVEIQAVMAARNADVPEQEDRRRVAEGLRAAGLAR
jgi:adenylate cyclase